MQNVRYHFGGDYSITTDPPTLTKGNVLIETQPTPLKLLAFLASKHDYEVSVNDIADVFGIAPVTVRVHISNLYKLFGGIERAKVFIRNDAHGNYRLLATPYSGSQPSEPGTKVRDLRKWNNSRLGVIPYNEYIIRALNLVRDALAPFVRRQLQERRPHDWQRQVVRIFAEEAERPDFDLSNVRWDAYYTLKAVTDPILRNEVFKDGIPSAAISVAFELFHLGNRTWHAEEGKSATEDDAYRALDNAVLLLDAIAATPEVAQARALRREFRDTAPRQRPVPLIPTLDEERYILKCPATLQEYDQSWRITTEFFDSHDLVDGAADREAFMRNPFSMVVVLDPITREVIGYVDIYHFPDDVLEALINDRTGDAPFDITKLLPYEDACRASQVYVATIIIRGDLRHRFAASLPPALIYGMLEFLKRHQFVGVDRLTIYAVPFTPEGESILRRLEFEYSHQIALDTDGSTGDLYCKTVTKDQVIAAQAYWGTRCESAVSLEFK
jgi:hypothetical protein